MKFIPYLGFTLPKTILFLALIVFLNLQTVLTQRPPISRFRANQQTPHTTKVCYDGLCRMGR